MRPILNLFLKHVSTLRNVCFYRASLLHTSLTGVGLIAIAVRALTIAGAEFGMTLLGAVATPWTFLSNLLLEIEAGYALENPGLSTTAVSSLFLMLVLLLV